MQKTQQAECEASPQFSLVLCTINRKKEVDKFLESLAKQAFKKFEVIIVDQNEDGLLNSIIAKWQNSLVIEHIKVDFRGLSKARNFGMKYTRGELIAFPDDDCEYQPSTLEKTERVLHHNPAASIVIGKQISKIGVRSDSLFAPANQIKNVLDIFSSKAISFTIFVRANCIDRLGPGIFDESFGVGAGTKWGSGEETDFLIRAHKAGLKIFKQPAIEIFHPEKISSPKRCLHYGLGRYKVIKKNRLGFIVYAINLLQPIARLLLKNEYHFLLSHLCTILGRSGLPLLFGNFRIRLSIKSKGIAHPSSSKK